MLDPSRIWEWCCSADDAKYDHEGVFSALKLIIRPPSPVALLAHLPGKSAQSTLDKSKTRGFRVM
jgi:hypothetical protein